MVKQKVTKLLRFVSFVITVWILCIAYAIASLGDRAYYFFYLKSHSIK